MRVGLPMLFGIAIGLIMAVNGLTILNTHLGVETIVDNPLYQAPGISAMAWTGVLGPDTMQGGVDIYGLNDIIFMGYLLSMALILFFVGIIMFFLMFVFGPSVPFMYFIFATFTIITFLLVYWLGSAYILNIG